MHKISILNVGVTNAEKDEVLEFLKRGIQKKEKKLTVFTPNPEIIMYAQKDDSFRNMLNQADIALADGAGVVWASRLMGKPLKERITGIDFMRELCGMAAENGFTVGLFGGRENVAEKTSECLLQMHPKLSIAFAKEVWEEGLRADILFVALGHPKQERWIFENLPKTNVHVAMTVGGAFDYLSGNVPRAPKFLRDFGFEWLFRLVREPWRIRRQIALPTFVFLVLKEKLFQKSV